MAMYRMIGWVLLWRVESRSRPVRSGWLRESNDLLTPVAVGILRPRVILPAGWRMWDRQTRKAILAHEFAHVRRHDTLVSGLAQLVTCLFWFQPLAWWAARNVAQLAESACDAVALERVDDAAGYSRILLAFAADVQRAGHHVTLPGLAMAAGSGMEHRVNQVFELSNGRLRRMPRAGALLALMGLPVLAVAATLELAERTSDARPAPVRQGPMPVLLLDPQPQRKSGPDPQQIATPYLKWQREDVAYIIRDEERQAFNRLTTDVEREKFIEQFWLVRDPTPGTAANEFKEEHYRRIAYTNQHYGYNAKSLPGWKTDRGRIYITYGPADEIEDHANGGEYKRPPKREPARWKFSPSRNGATAASKGWARTSSSSSSIPP